MVISSRFQVLTSEKSLLHRPEIPSLFRKPVEDIKNKEFFSKVIPQPVNKNSIHVAKRFPDIDRLFSVISSFTETSI